MKKYEKYALGQKDTFNYIRGVELECKVYDLLGDTIKWTERLETAARLYREIGLDNYAVRTLSSIICVNVERGDLELAAQQMRLYENNSGLFDEDGNIQAGLEIYYYFKGSYYLQKGAADSAEYYMRKLLGYDDVNACRGLIKLYRKKQVIDSVAKYSMLFEAANDSVTNARRTGIIHQMSSLYKYHQFQVKADKAERRERRTRLFAIAFVVIAFTVISGGFYIHRRFRAKKLSEINKLSLKYSRALSDYHRINEDLDLLRTNSHALLEKKKQETDVLKAKIREYQERWQTISQSDKEGALKNSDLVRQFHDKARGSRKTTLPTVDMWMSLSKQFAQNMPFIHAIMTNAVDKLSVLESRAYMLLELDFSNSEICILLDVSPQRLSNIKTRINQKLFNDNSASTLKSNVNNALRADL